MLRGAVAQRVEGRAGSFILGFIVQRAPAGGKEGGGFGKADKPGALTGRRGNHRGQECQGFR